MKIKTCPFCGGNAHVHTHERYGIECDECGMGAACVYSTPEEAIQAWNMRVTDAHQTPCFMEVNHHD